jgi:c-di-GMP-binding flagellar brake protein YcgR
VNAVESFADRRQHPRSDLLVSVRPPGEQAADSWHSTRDLSAGGMRLLSDRALLKGDRLPLEILLPDGSWLAVTTKVAWSVKLDVGSTAEYEVGLRFLDLDAESLERLQPLLPQQPGVFSDGGRREG